MNDTLNTSLNNKFHQVRETKKIIGGIRERKAQQFVKVLDELFEYDEKEIQTIPIDVPMTGSQLSGATITEKEDVEKRNRN